MSKQRVEKQSAVSGNDDVPSGEENSATALDLHTKLVVIFGEQLDRFKSEGGVGDVEQAAKALSILAKTLESIAAVSIKLGGTMGQHHTQRSGGAHDALSQSRAGGIQELDRQIVQLVEGLVQAGEDGRISRSSE